MVERGSHDFEHMALDGAEIRLRLEVANDAEILEREVGVQRMVVLYLARSDPTRGSTRDKTHDLPPSCRTERHCTVGPRQP